MGKDTKDKTMINPLHVYVSHYAVAYIISDRKHPPSLSINTARAYKYSPLSRIEINDSGKDPPQHCSVLRNIHKPKTNQKV